MTSSQKGINIPVDDFCTFIKEISDIHAQQLPNQPNK